MLPLGLLARCMAEVNDNEHRIVMFSKRYRMDLYSARAQEVKNTGCELRVASYELRAASHKPQATSYKLQASKVCSPQPKCKFHLSCSR
jgi:hypothetical protein